MNFTEFKKLIKNSDMKTAIIKTYPEFDNETKIIVSAVIAHINKNAKNIESEMRYKHQFLLERVIAELTKLV